MRQAVHAEGVKALQSKPDSIGPTEKVGAGADSVVLEPIGRADVVGEVDQFIYWETIK